MAAAVAPPLVFVTVGVVRRRVRGDGAVRRLEQLLPVLVFIHAAKCQSEARAFLAVWTELLPALSARQWCPYTTRSASSGRGSDHHSRSGNLCF